MINKERTGFNHIFDEHEWCTGSQRREEVYLSLISIDGKIPQFLLENYGYK